MKHIITIAALLGLFMGFDTWVEYEQYNFQPGDCVNNYRWVPESRELIGNTYFRVQAKTNAPYYIVKSCTLNTNQYSCGNFSEVCHQIESKNLYEFRRIKCPTVILKESK